jgi:hypothetical protein
MTRAIVRNAHGHGLLRAVAGDIGWPLLVSNIEVIREQARPRGQLVHKIRRHS